MLISYGGNKLKNQLCFYGEKSIDDFVDYIKKRYSKLMIVSGNLCNRLLITEKITSKLNDVVFFSDFLSNPTYEAVKNGVKLFNNEDCDAILAIGGGSAMDVAKCIKLFATMKPDENYLFQEYIDNDIKLFAIPTTAGTGSEATRFAVIYYNGEKQSVTHSSLVPSAVLFEASSLKSLSDYQRKSAMLDAMCHAIESFWSVNSTDESKKYSKEALKLIFGEVHNYLDNTDRGNTNMLRAANLAGKAINISQTTAAHAMCYKITSVCKISHGHAAACILPELWNYMFNNMDKCVDRRGGGYLNSIFEQIAVGIGSTDVLDAINKIKKLFFDLGLNIPKIEEKDIKSFVLSVNTTRLKNNPVLLSEKDIEKIYRNIFISEME